MFYNTEHESDNLFKQIDPQEDLRGEQFKKIIRDNYKKMPRCKKSYRTANKTWLEVQFTETKCGVECTIRFFYRSWRWVNETFFVERKQER